jgi:PAS domain S-box-containing protein
MKIRNLLIVSVVTFSIVLVIISGLVIVTNQQIGKLVNQEATANTIVLEVGELGYLSNDYILFREPQQSDRWNTKFASVSDDIASLSVDQPEQQAIVSNLKANLRNTRSVFDDIVSSPAQSDRTADIGFVQLSWSRMAVQNQGMVFDAGRLANLLHAESEGLMQVRNLLIFALMGVFIAFLLTSYFIFYRRALKSISELNKGTKEIGSGNLYYTIEEVADDEIGDLSRALNRMTADLRKLTASKSDLEKEVSERMRAEAQLVRNNEDLNAINEELTATQEELQQNVEELSRREIELHSVALFPTENPSPTMRVNAGGILLFANPASTHVLTFWKAKVGEKIPGYIMQRAHESLKHGIIKEAEEICEPFTYSIRFVPLPEQNYINLYFSDITTRKQLEENLQNTLQRFYKILSEMPYGILLVTDNNQVEFVNQTFCDVFDLNDSPAELVNLTADEMLNKIRHSYKDPEAALTRIREIVSLGQTVRGEDVLIGTDRVFQRDFIPVHISNNQFGRLWIHIEITERRKIEEALRMSEERLRLAQEGSGAGIWDWNIRSGRIVWDSNMFKLFGFDPEKDHASFEHWNQIIHPEDAEDANARIEKALKDHTKLSNEYRIILPTDEIRWISAMGKGIYDENGAPVRMSGICIDITERRKVEEALQESEARFRLALKNAPVSVAIQDRDLVLQWVYNPRSIRPEDITGKKDADLFSPEEAAHLLEIKRRILETGEQVREKIWLTLNGKPSFIDLYLEPLLDDHGHITGIGIATVDLTEQKLVEDALRYSEENLLQAQELLEAVTKGTDVIIAVQDTNLRYIFFNQTYKEVIKRITGKDLTIGTSMIELFEDIPEEQKRSINEWSRVLDGENVNETIVFGEPGRDRRVYHVLHTPIRDAVGTIVAAGEVAYDITRQTQVEHTLRETKEYLDNLITYANAPIIVWDPQFRITLFNHAFEHLTGRKAKDVLGKPLDILLPENYLITAMDLIRKTQEGERWESVELPILHKKGVVRTVLWNSASILGHDGTTIVSTIAQGHDITDRKKIESEFRLRAAEYAKMNVALEEEIRQRKISDATLKNTLSLLNASLESTADGILVVDQQGRITSYNQNFINMWDITESLLESRENNVLMKYVLPQLKNPDEFLTRIKELEDHPARESFDMIEFNDGKIFERYSKPQQIGDSVVGRVWSFRDITDRKHAEEKLVSSIQEKEILLREIHHRVKNNLQLISGLLDMTRMRTSDESTNSILTDLMLKIQTMAQIHTRLYESKQFGKISLTGQIRDQITALSNIYSHKGHEIICEIAAEEIFLPVDQAIPCALVVNEILSNAYKHAFKGRKCGTIEISAVEEEGQIRITVRDDGIGIPSNFDISRAQSLGLKLIRNLVQYQLKGSLMFKTQNGTEFSMEFPVISAGT